MNKLFEGRRLIIATNHGKEKVLAPLLEEGLGVKCDVPQRFVSDTLGTFSGEIERLGTPHETLIQKARQCSVMENCDLIVASEGSFGPHPSSFFISANEEMVCLIDFSNSLEIVVSELSTKTNLSGIAFSTLDELVSFAEKIQFPSHGLILRQDKNSLHQITKGITVKEELLKCAEKLLADHGHGYAETDMRAHMNPTRMRVIEKAGVKLVEKIKTLCPSCEMPGFGITDRKSGLPCKACGFPTQSTLAFVQKCTHCSFEKELPYPHNKRFEEPMYCDHCNP